MSKQVKEYCAQCHGCLVNKKGLIPKAPLQKFEEVVAPFARVACDLVGPLPKTPRGMVFCLTVLDHFTRYAEIIPLPNSKGQTIAKAFLKSVVLRHGCPEALLTDLGRNLVKGVMAEMCKILQIKRLYCTPYSPTTQGMNERIHKELAMIIRQFADKDRLNWDEIIPFVLFAYRNSIHSSTHETPHFLLYGRDPILPETLLLASTRREVMSREDYSTDLVVRLQWAHRVVREQLESTWEKREKQYNKQVKERGIRLGDKVYCKVEFTRQGENKKLAPKWEGPYRVVALVNNVNVRIQKIFGKGPGDNSKLIHVNKLKLCPRDCGPRGLPAPASLSQVEGLEGERATLSLEPADGTGSQSGGKAAVDPLRNIWPEFKECGEAGPQQSGAAEAATDEPESRATSPQPGPQPAPEAGPRPGPESQPFGRPAQGRPEADGSTPPGSNDGLDQGEGDAQPHGQGQVLSDPSPQVTRPHTRSQGPAPEHQWTPPKGY